MFSPLSPVEMTSGLDTEIVHHLPDLKLQREYLLYHHLCLSDVQYQVKKSNPKNTIASLWFLYTFA